MAVTSAEAIDVDCVVSPGTIAESKPEAYATCSRAPRKVTHHEPAYQIETALRFRCTTIARQTRIRTMPAPDEDQTMERRVAWSSKGDATVIAAKITIAAFNQRVKPSCSSSVLRSEVNRAVVNNGCAANVARNTTIKSCGVRSIPIHRRSQPSFIEATRRLVISHPENKKKDQSRFKSPIIKLSRASPTKAPNRPPPARSN